MPDSALNPPTAWRMNTKDGGDASRRAIGLVASHPFSVRYVAPVIMRLQRVVTSASTVACQAADNQAKLMTLRYDTCTG